MQTIRASEIGTYLFCQRAWWYAKSGVPSTNQAELSIGHEIHLRHGRAVLRTTCVQVVGYLLFLFSLILLIIYLTGQIH